MQLQSNKLNFEGVDIYVGIDTHKTNWKVAIRIGDIAYNEFSLSPPDPAQLPIVLVCNEDFPKLAFVTPLDNTNFTSPFALPE